MALPIKQTFQQDMLIRSIKIMDIGYIGITYFTLGLVLSRSVDSFLGVFDKEKEDKKSFLRHILEVFFIIWSFSIITYFIRNIAELLPSPFDGIYGFEHKRVKELGSASVFVFVFLYFQSYYKEKFTFLYKKYLF